MAGTSTGDFRNGAPFYLDPDQQDLLLAALSSNTQNSNNLFAGMDGTNKALNDSSFQYTADSLDPTSFFTSPHQDTAFANSIVDESPYVDHVDGDNFDLDNAEGDLMIGSLPGDSPTKGDDGTEKRKSPDDEEEDADGGGGKRREGEDKQAKKPGRKPLTSEPTTKRKAQNRAAQRAFRERKEKHLKDLETKVAELEKASDATNHENGLLRAQVQRLQVELREYRKRLSLNSAGINRSPSMMAGFSNLLTGGGANASSFQFEFPRFGNLPGSHILDNGPLSKNKSVSVSSTTPARQNSTGRSLSPQTQNGATPAAQSQYSNSRSNSIPNPPSSATTDASNPARVFHFNSNSSTHSGSPSASSVSAGANSSCDTSPEPSHSSPKNPDTIADGYVCHGNSEGEITFCEMLNMACGNPRNPIPRAMSVSKSSDAKPKPAGLVNINKSPAVASSTNLSGINTNLTTIDVFANQNGGQFEPALFGEYRDSQNAIMGDGDFTNGFFNDAFPLGDYASPFHFGDTPAIQKADPLEDFERLQDGEDEVVPGEDTSQMLNCHKIWDKLANRPDFKDGTIDIDNLCSELRSKARCSESGVVVDHKDVEEALKRLPKEQTA